MLYTDPPNPIKTFAGDCHRSFHGRILKRLRLGLSGEERRFKTLLLEMQHKFKSQKVVIVGNGPSLRHTDRELLSRFHLVGLNRGILMNSDIRDSYAICVAADLLNYTQNKLEYQKIQVPLLLEISAKEFCIHPNAYYFGSSSDQLPYARPCPMIPSFGNSTAIAAQFLFYCGVKHVALVGVDNDYGNQRPLSIVKSEELKNQYYSKSNAITGKMTQVLDPLRTEYHLRNLSYLYSDHGRILVNCSEISMLTTLPKMTLEAFAEV